MPTLGFDLNDQALTWAVNHASIQGDPVSAGSISASSINNIEMVAAITAAGPTFGEAACMALEAQPELPAASDWLGELGSSKRWYHDALGRTWEATELMHQMLEQSIQSAREIAFESHWQAVIAVETERYRRVEQAVAASAQTSAANWTLQALVSRQLALAVYWSSRCATSQTVIAIDWAPRQVHLGVFTCSGGTFKILQATSISDVGLEALEQSLADCLQGDDSMQLESRAIRRLWQEVVDEPVGVGRQSVWQRAGITEVVLLREQLQQVVQPFIARILVELAGMFEGLPMASADVDRWLLLGGPHAMLQAALFERFQVDRQSMSHIEQGSAIATGAALLSGMSSAERTKIMQADDWLRSAPDHRVTCAAHRSATTAECDIGLRVVDPTSGKSMIYRMLSAKAPRPDVRRRVFRTSRQNQARLVLDLVYLEPGTGRLVHQETRSLRLPPNLPALSTIEVTLV